MGENLTGAAAKPGFVSAAVIAQRSLTRAIVLATIFGMKRSPAISLSAGLRLAAVHFALVLCPALQAAVTFTVTPAAVSNTYDGVITLQVKGLTNGETVVVQKFIDFDGAGVIDASAWLAQQFQLTDGQPGMAAGGIVNSNVPGDTDSTAGQITAKMSFVGGDFLQNFGCKYLYKVSSPAGRFTPVTNLLSVANVAYPQKFTGTVVISGTSTPVPNAVVVLQNENGATAGVSADASGNYTIQAPPGAYGLMAFKNNYVFPNSKTLGFTLGSGQTVTTNLAMMNATASISGRLVDANNSGIGLPGVLVTAEASNGLMGVGSTDTNGNFTLGVLSNPGQWELRADDTSLIVHGYPGLQDRASVNAGETGVILSVTKGTALFYGYVRDSLGNPLPGIDVYANDNNNLYETDGYTDANGNYCAAVAGGLNNDPWQVEVSSGSGPANYIFSQPAFDENGGMSMSGGQAVLANFTAIPANEVITGTVTDWNNEPIAGVGVWAGTTINGVDYSQYADTDANGYYSLTVANGNWTLDVNCNGGDDSLDSILGGGNYQCPDNQDANINNKSATVNFIVEAVQPLAITTSSLPDGNAGVYYNQSLAVAGGQPPYSWWLPGGTQTLPPGAFGDMSFSSEGNNAVISGTPATAGTFSFWVGVYDNASPPDMVTQMFSITIQGQASPLEVTTSYLPNGTNGGFYTQALQASGGQAPYTWSIPDYSSGPPPGLTLAADGVLSGTPATNGTFYFYARVTDAAMNTADSSSALQLNIVNAPLQVTNVSLPKGAVGAPYSAQLGATGGQPPCSFSLATGSANPPPGLSLNSAGLISGTPTTSGTFGFLVTAHDNYGDVSPNRPLAITINSAPVLGSPSWAANQFTMRLTGATNQNYTLQVSTSLNPPNWTPLFVTNSATLNSFIVTDPAATNTQRFYRLSVGP